MGLNGYIRLLLLFSFIDLIIKYIKRIAYHRPTDRFNLN